MICPAGAAETRWSGAAEARSRPGPAGRWRRSAGRARPGRAPRRPPPAGPATGCRSGPLPGRPSAGQGTVAVRPAPSARRPPRSGAGQPSWTLPNRSIHVTRRRDHRRPGRAVRRPGPGCSRPWPTSADRAAGPVWPGRRPSPTPPGRPRRPGGRRPGRRGPARRRSRPVTAAARWPVPPVATGAPRSTASPDAAERLGRRESRPLSGPTSHAGPPRAAAVRGRPRATARRSVPTPGSTTASTTPGPEVGGAPDQHGGAGGHVEGGDLVGEVDDRDAGARRWRTAWTTPTNSSAVP